MVDRTPKTAKGRRVTNTCTICGEDYLIAKKIAERYSTCSVECSSERRRRHRQIHPSNVTCEQCGKTVKRAVYMQRFCSNACRLEALNALPRTRTTGFFGAQLHPKGYVRGSVWRGDRRVTIMEHRYVMEQHIGRELTPVERVHHINGDRADNRIENLRLYASQAEHIRECHPYLVHNLPHRAVD